MATCAVSVIIPLYNAGKYIRQCLISVLTSKFKDYEVLVVDDCSTDNSVAEVEKLLPHFDGRLRLLHTEKNSGGAGVPRNVGIRNATGKYILFLDADDFLLPTALDNLFELAEDFQADVVHTEKFLVFNDAGKGKFRWEELKLERHETGACVEEPTLEPEDLAERIKRYVDGKYLWVPWGKLYRRAFLLDNNILFPQMKNSSDMVYCFECLCLARRYLRVPHVTNIYRVFEGSTSRKVVTSREGVERWLSFVTIGVQSMAEFMDGLEFFKAYPSLRHDVLRFFIEKHFSFIKNLFQGLKPHEVQRIFYEELQSPDLDSRGKDIIAAYLYAERAMNQTR